ncbi:MAG TPA: ATP-binding cassette domain-containing protein, partial [Aquamicrobium sp.]|nr:ATP-binding cassette domain-containing protein [Aquamicrobium sp.]
MADAALEIAGVDAFYGEVQALRSLSLTLERGEVLCLLGRNGAGKTTTLKAIMGLVTVRGGTIVKDGVDLTR